MNKLSTRTYWFLNNSRGGSTSFDAKARSGRRDVNIDVNVAAKVGSESSEIA